MVSWKRGFEGERKRRKKVGRLGQGAKERKKEKRRNQKKILAFPCDIFMQEKQQREGEQRVVL